MKHRQAHHTECASCVLHGDHALHVLQFAGATKGRQTGPACWALALEAIVVLGSGVAWLNSALLYFL
jgi:hypothetical protein